jgi:mRNA interferase MazF
MVTYVPDAADIIWITLNPRTGHEQAGRRPFLVMTPQRYNVKTSLLIGCPITSVSKGYPFEVALSEGGAISGVILADQVRSVDWRRRKAAYIERASRAAHDRARALIGLLLGDAA